MPFFNRTTTTRSTVEDAIATFGAGPGGPAACAKADVETRQSKTARILAGTLHLGLNTTARVAISVWAKKYVG
jgi:hypothetical protein